MATPTQRIYTKPFCNSGNKVIIPTDEPTTLEVNQETGYTPPYSQELGGLYIEREAFNGIINATQQQTLINAQGIDDINTKLETDYVSIKGNEIINGSKTFTNAVTCNGTITNLKHLATVEKCNALIKPTDDKANTNAQAIANINNQLTTKVSLTGDETIAGTKTFSSNVIIPNATANTHALNLQTANLKYVALSGNQTIAGAKTFLEVPQCSVNANANNQLVNWQTLQAQITAKSGSVTLKGTRTTSGTWTIIGLIPNKPLFLILDQIAPNRTATGVVGTVKDNTYSGWIELRNHSLSSYYFSGTQCAILMPTQNTLTIDLKECNRSIYAFQ